MFYCRSTAKFWGLRGTEWGLLSGRRADDNGQALRQSFRRSSHRNSDGFDVGFQRAFTTLVSLLEALDLKDAAARLAQPDADLLGANRARIGRAEALMQEFGVRGVPAWIVESGAKDRVLDHTVAYSNPHALTSQLQAASVVPESIVEPAPVTPFHLTL